MQEAQKQCSKCGETKTLEGFSYNKRDARYTSQCKVCRNAGIKAAKTHPKYKVKERERSARRREYINQWNKSKSVVLNERRRKKESTRIVCASLLSCKVYFLTCQHTGDLFTSSSCQSKYSNEGRRLVGLLKAKEYEARLHEAKQLEFECKQCGSLFKPVYGVGNTVYCSVACSSEAHIAYKWATGSHRKRARYFGVAYEPVNIGRVFRRDKWTCQLCGVSTPEDKRGSYEDDAPELDHIIPMSKGGSHTLDNVQCLCRRCNSLKSDRMPVKPQGGCGVFSSGTYPLPPQPRVAKTYVQN